LKNIYILRHGQTDYNKKGMVQGRGVDAPLNETGHQQAFSAYQVLSKKGIDKIYTSSLKRTSETVTHFTQPKEAHDGFDEISWGSQEGVVPDPDAKNLYFKTVSGWRSGQLEMSVGGGESPLEVQERQEAAIGQVLQEEVRNVLICMHGRAMRILLCWLLGYPLSYMDGFPHENCGYYHLIWTGDRYYVKAFNQTRHLAHIRS
jgi:probable phosphoglycerate mutase